MPTKRSGRRRRNGNPKGVVSLERLPTHRLQRTVVRTLAQIATDQGYVFAHNPSTEIADWSSLANCFDQYRVVRVDLKFMLPRSDVAEFPTLLFAPDFNDSTIPAFPEDVLNYETVKVHQFCENARMRMFSYVPKLRSVTTGTSLDVAITGAGTWAHTSQTPLWLGSKQFLLQYNSTSNATALIQVYTTYTLEFKNSR